MTITIVRADQAISPPASPDDGTPVDLAGVVVVDADGDIDLYTGPDLRQALTRVMAAESEEAGGSRAFTTVPGPADQSGRPGSLRAVVVDLSDVDFIDSYAVGVLVQGHHLARRKGCGYVLVATHPMIHSLFAVTGLAKVLPLHPDVAAAAASLRPNRSAAAAAGSELTGG